MTPTGVEHASLVLLAKSNEVQQVRGLAEVLASFGTEHLVDGYHEVMRLAPRRPRDGKEFFVERRSRRIRRKDPKPTEDILEMALVNSHAQLPIRSGDVTVLMRQFPLFSSGSRKGVRAVDLVGHHEHRLWVIELKAQPSDEYGESPARALLEGLIYAAVVEANNTEVAEELRLKFDLEHRHPRPGIMIAAPSAYWMKWTPTPVTGEWWIQYTRLAAELSESIDTPIAMTDIGDVVLNLSHSVPRLDHEIKGHPVTYKREH